MFESFSRFHLILAWGLISATIGLILHILDNIAEKSGLLGKLILKIVIAMLGASWSLLTVFVVPGMVYDNLGPFAAIRNSVETFRRTWGENLIRQYGLGLVELLFIILGVIAGFGLLALSAMLSWIVLVLMILAIGLYFLGVILFFNLANGVFSTALYAYAKTGKIPEGYDQEILGNAFRKAA
ncbi:hypothetical protein HYY72_04380 [Candidatus Woesearchaeota archaeon]|nr:hypothetical protein [Candidatus Woesearchaeota archaeon]